MLSERMLKKWRKEALEDIQESKGALTKEASVCGPSFYLEGLLIKQNERILQLTQELLDLHLLKKG